MPAAEAPARRAALVLGLALLVGALAAAPATARDGLEHTMALDGVLVTVSSPWPDGVQEGWMPVRATFFNGRDERVAVRSTARQTNFWQAAATSGIELAAGERRTVDWLVPVHSRRRSAMDLHVVSSTGADDRVVLSTDPGTEVLDDHFTLLALAPGEAEPATIDHARAEAAAARVWGAGEEDWEFDPGEATVVRHDALPTDWRAYTSVTRLLLTTDEGVPGDAAMDAILAWVAAGGVLQVAGDARGLSLPLDDRFLRAPPPARADPDLLSTHRHAFGWIQRTRAPRADLTPNWYEALTLSEDQLAVMPAPGALPLQPSWADTSIPGLGAIPLTLLALVLVVFFLVMGPVQFFWLKQRKAKPATLLLTTPALGFGFAGLLVLASLFHQGLSVRESVTSITWLDQSRHHAATVARRTVFSGSVFDTALRYDAGTAALGLSQDTWQYPAYAWTRRGHLMHGPQTPPPVSRNEARYQVDLDRGVLGGSYLPVRAPVCEILAHSGTARERVALEREDGRLFVVNALGVDIDDLWLRDVDGASWRTGGPVPAGERRELSAFPTPVGSIRFESPHTPLRSFGALRLDNRRAWPDLGEFPEQAPRRCYVALLPESPFLDDGGVERTTVAARHVLFGDLGPTP